MPNLNAAFVDIGHGKDAFLHYHDLGPNMIYFENHNPVALPYYDDRMCKFIMTIPRI